MATSSLMLQVVDDLGLEFRDSSREPLDLRLRPWAPSMGPEPWDPYIPTIYPIGTFKGPWNPPKKAYSGAHT